jgi:phage virion morphogenesis protein
MIEVQFDDREIREALQRLSNATANLTPALQEIGEVLMESTKDRFGSLTGPSGERWPANSPVTLQNKPGNRPLTGETGALMDTIHWQLLSNNAVAIGSPMEYAAMQQFGGTKAEFPWLWGDIPARSFLGISDADKADILDIIQRHLEDATG